MNAWLFRACRNRDLKSLFHLWGDATGNTSSKTTAISTYKNVAMIVHWRLMLIYSKKFIQLLHRRILYVLWWSHNQDTSTPTTTYKNLESFLCRANNRVKMAKPVYAFILDTWIIRVTSMCYIYMQCTPWNVNLKKSFNFQEFNEK